MKGISANLGFIFHPTNMHPTSSSVAVPPWNSQDDNLPSHFFGLIKNFLVDDDYVIVVHSGHFKNIAKVMESARQNKCFQYLCQYTLILTSPFSMVMGVAR